MKFLLTAISMIVFASSLWCQNVPKAEVFVGYSYLNIDMNNLGPRQSANGWEVSPSASLNKWLAVEFDVNGYYKTYPDILLQDYSYLAGPRLNFRPFFVHALVGGDDLRGSASGSSASQDSLAGAFGGGIEWPLSRRLAVRGSSDYVFTRHNITGGPSVTQNNFRVSAGIVFTFGGQSATRGPVRPHSGVVPEQSSNTSEAALLGVVGYPTEDGFKVTSIRLGSPAERISLKPDDIINKIDDKDVHTSREIESAIAASASGTITVSGFTHVPALGEVILKREVKVR